MKKNFVFLAILAMVFGLAVIGCGGDDDNGNGNGNGNNNNGGGATVPTDLQGTWKFTWDNNYGTKTVTIDANTHTYEQLIYTVTSGGVQHTNVKLKLTYTITACKQATNSDNGSKAEFPSGYRFTEKLTAIENSHPAIQTNSSKVGDAHESDFYLNTAKDKMIGGYAPMATGSSYAIYTKQ
jgi:hypothetical protein